MDLSDLIDRNADFTPDKAAIHFRGETLCYGELAARIAVTARALKSEAGVDRGDRVALLATNHPDYLVLLYACARLGAMLVPLNWRLAALELHFILSDAAASVVIVEQAFAKMIPVITGALPHALIMGLDFAPPLGPSLDELRAAGHGDDRNPQVNFDCALLVVYTSGTTGRPKGAVLRQEALVWNAVMSQHMHSLTAADHVLTVLPLFHVGGLNIQTTPALQLGATVTLHQRFTPDETLSAIAESRPTRTALIPATLQAVIEHPKWNDTNLSSLRSVTTGSTLVPQFLVDAVTARGVPVLQVYGATETCPIAVYTRLGGDASQSGSAGQAGLHCEVRIVDAAGRAVADSAAGEIVVRGPNVFCAYWGDEAGTREVLRDGWYHTGDIATRDRNGRFFIHDRKNNVIISGGENVYPAEIESVLHDHPAVAEVAVIGRPDSVWQEAPVAYVVKKPDMAIDADTLTHYAGQRLARFKIPREFIFVESLPHNALGKVQHFRIRQQQVAAAPVEQI